MPLDDDWHQPSTTAMELISRIYRFSKTLEAMSINPGAAGVALIISLDEAFVLLDYLRTSRQMELLTPTPDSPVGYDTVLFDLLVSPQPGLRWGLLFGITLIVEEACDTMQR